MTRQMEVEVLFLDPNAVGPSSAVLSEHGFDVEVLDWTDPHGPTVWLKGRIMSELDEDRFFDWVMSIVEPLHGDVVEAGLSNPQQAA
jgi:hypothetical protein